MPRVVRIFVYPFKSLDAQSVEGAVLLPGGGLEHDRQFALYDHRGEWINGKSTPQVHRLRSRVDLATRSIELRVEGTSERVAFKIDDQRAPLIDWLSDYFGQRVTLEENPAGGFPDDSESPGPTLIGTATLAAVAGWFDLPLDEVRGRFRANLEIEGVEAFWEDRLVEGAGRPVRFSVGQAELLGTNPCARCVVPTRSPLDGATSVGFAKAFAQWRRQTLPSWAPLERFDHFFRLALNTRGVHSRSATIAVGDEVRIESQE